MMSFSVKKVFCLLAIATVIGAIAFALLPDSSKSGAFAAGKCPNTACKSPCWIDGTVENKGTVAIQKLIAPAECGVGFLGCVTEPCR